MKKKILTFGLLPIMYGGKHNAGIGHASFDLAKAISDKKETFNHYYSAYDFSGKAYTIDKLKILGFIKVEIFTLLLTKPLSIFHYINKALSFSRKYKEHFLKILLKLLFLDVNLKILKPDIIFLNGTHDVLLLEYCKYKKSDAKIFCKIHGINYINKQQKKYFNIEKDISKLKIDHLFFLSSFVQKQWIELYGKLPISNYVLLNGYNPKFFYPLNKTNSSNKIILLTVATISELKGQKRVLEAIKIAGSSKFKYICIGSPNDLSNNLIEYAKTNNIDFEYYNFKTKDELRVFYSKADYMILPSKNEGFGLVFIESIACGTPVIIPKHLPLVKEGDILNNDNSIFIESEKVEDITSCLNKINQYSFNREKVSSSVANLTWDKIANDYIIFFNEIFK